jgi:hypothetical protein
MKIELDHIQITKMYITACGPSTLPSIAHEIFTQVNFATKENSVFLAEEAIANGMNNGWLEKYDEQSYCIA